MERVCLDLNILTNADRLWFMKTMILIDPKKLHASQLSLLGAFDAARNAVCRQEEMRAQLYDDIDVVQGIVAMAEFDNDTEDARTEVVDIMKLPEVREVIDRVNHLTSPDMYSRLSQLCPNVAAGYMQLKTCIGQLEQAVATPIPYVENFDGLNVWFGHALKQG